MKSHAFSRSSRDKVNKPLPWEGKKSESAAQKSPEEEVTRSATLAASRGFYTVSTMLCLSVYFGCFR